jgi:hypothetical protein
MKYPTLSYSKSVEEGVVRFPKDFTEADRVFQLDNLTDWIAELEQYYNKLLSDPEGE